MIGGGITGMSAALELAKTGLKLQYLKHQKILGDWLDHFMLMETLLKSFIIIGSIVIKKLQLIEELGESKTSFIITLKPVCITPTVFSNCLDQEIFKNLNRCPFGLGYWLGLGNIRPEHKELKILEKHQAFNWLPKVFGRKVW